jgi:hypothetical protein
LLRVIGAKNNARVNLKISEPEGSERRPPKADVPAAADTAAQEPPRQSVDEAIDDLNL